MIHYAHYASLFLFHNKLHNVRMKMNLDKFLFIRKSSIYYFVSKLLLEQFTSFEIPFRTRSTYTQTTNQNTIHASSNSNLNNRPPSLRREWHRSGFRPQDLVPIRISFKDLSRVLGKFLENRFTDSDCRRYCVNRAGIFLSQNYNISSILIIFKYKPGKTNNKFITSQ